MKVGPENRSQDEEELRRREEEWRRRLAELPPRPTRSLKSNQRPVGKLAMKTEKLG